MFSRINEKIPALMGNGEMKNENDKWGMGITNGNGKWEIRNGEWEC